jgi:hypothetical protein
MGKWSAQYTGRLEGIDFNFFGWIQNIPRSLIYFLPWLLLFPFARFSKFHDQAQLRLAWALSWGTAVPFVAVNLVPGAVARYSMPAIVPASWLLGMICAGNALEWPGWITRERAWTNVVAAFAGLGLVIGAVGYPVTAVILRNRQQVKRAAAEINALVPTNETLYAVNPDYQPVFFYLNAPVKYASYVRNLPANTHYFVIQSQNEAEATKAQKFAPRRAYVLARIRTHGQRELILFRVGQ